MLNELDVWMLTVTPILLQYSLFALPTSDLSKQENSAKKHPNVLTDSISSKKSGADKFTSFSLGVVKISPYDLSQKLYRVMNLPEVRVELEHLMTKLKMHLVSFHLGNLKSKGESLLDTLSQLLEIVEMLSECQAKVTLSMCRLDVQRLVIFVFVLLLMQWDQLSCLFDSIEKDLRDDLGLANLQTMTTKFQEIARSIRDDPRLLSLLYKRQGQKGFRDLQGEALRLACKSILNLHVMVFTLDVLKERERYFNVHTSFQYTYYYFYTEFHCTQSRMFAQKGM